ncbi:MAG: HAD family hydrolase [Solirubrobacterales bacterium]
MPAAAFFDLDRTLMAGSSGLHWGRAAYGARLISLPQIISWTWDGLRFRLRGATDAQTQALLEQINETLAGISRTETVRLAPEVLAGILPRIYPQMLDEVRRHQDAGRATFIVSAASNALVEILAQVLAMDGGIGTRYEIDADDRFTGQLDGPFIYGEGKVVAMRRYASSHDIDLDASWAYSDSASDEPMLRVVGHPVAVNPDPELARIAVEEGWEVQRFEKLGRRLAIVATTVLVGAVGGSGTWLALRRRPYRYRISRRLGFGGTLRQLRG